MTIAEASIGELPIAATPAPVRAETPPPTRIERPKTDVPEQPQAR